MEDDHEITQREARITQTALRAILPKLNYPLSGADYTDIYNIIRVALAPHEIEANPALRRELRALLAEDESENA